MKKLLTLVIFAVALLAPAARAQFTTTISFIGTNPSFDDKGGLLAASVQAMFNQTMVVGDKTVAVTPAPNISWDGTDKKTTVTVDGVTVSYYQVTMFAAAIANQELAAGAGSQAKAKADKAAADAAAAKAAADKAAADAAAKAGP